MARVVTIVARAWAVALMFLPFAPALAADVSFKSVACEGAYPRHLQGICTDATGSIFWSFTSFLVKTDLEGKLLKKVPVTSHHGDLCFDQGKVYVAVNLGTFSDPKGKAAKSWVCVYRAEDLAVTARYQVPEVVYGAGGIGCDGHRFIVIGGLPNSVKENYAYEYDRTFKFSKRHEIKSGHTDMGIQTATWSGGFWWFGCYGSPPVLLKTDESFRLVAKYGYDCALGIAALPNEKFLVGRGGLLPSEESTGSVFVVGVDAKNGLTSPHPGASR
jgi:hypothetical protein